MRKMQRVENEKSRSRRMFVRQTRKLGMGPKARGVLKELLVAFDKVRKISQTGPNQTISPQFSVQKVGTLFSRFCVPFQAAGWHNVSYFLFAGSLLGAYRQNICEAFLHILQHIFFIKKIF